MFNMNYCYIYFVIIYVYLILTGQTTWPKPNISIHSYYYKLNSSKRVDELLPQTLAANNGLSPYHGSHPYQA